MYTCIWTRPGIYIYKCVCAVHTYKYISRRLHVCIHNDIHVHIIDKYIYIFVYSLLLTHIYNEKNCRNRLTVIFHQVAGASSKAPSGDPVPHLGPKADSIGI